MKSLFVLTVILISYVGSIPTAVSKDALPAPDYPGVGRLAGYDAQRYEVRKTQTLDFQLKDQTIHVDGRRIFASYTCTPSDSVECESILGVQKNFEAVLRKLGGEILHEDPPSMAPNGHLIARFGKNEATVYLDLHPWNDGAGYDLTILEEREFSSSMTANAGSGGDVKDSLNKVGKAVVYVQFDFDKANLRPDSGPIVKQIVDAMQADPSMKLEVDGHTDSLGTDAHNKALSKQRADAVAAAIVASGVSAARLTSAGFGSSVPLGDNATTDGRAQNRRVELIKK